MKLILHGGFLAFKDSKKNFLLEIPLCDDIDNTRISIEVKTVGHFTPAFAAWANRGADTTKGTVSFLLDLIFVPMSQ